MITTIYELGMNRETISQRLLGFTDEELLQTYDELVWKFEHVQNFDLEEIMWRLVEELTSRRVVFW